MPRPRSPAPPGSASTTVGRRGGGSVPEIRVGAPHDTGTRTAARSRGQHPDVRRQPMINRHPRRVLLTLVVLAAAFFALGGPGRNDTSGPWMYISGLSFIAFLLTAVVFVVLAGYLVAARLRARRTRADG